MYFNRITTFKVSTMFVVDLLPFSTIFCSIYITYLRVIPDNQNTPFPENPDSSTTGDRPGTKTPSILIFHGRLNKAQGSCTLYNAQCFRATLFLVSKHAHTS